ncbi:acyltransferase [Chitinophaga sp. 22536]|uniref:acyltransferase n=1 Tax=unclassified Chitinophaga TaxID=2619133 RepID=UPI003F82567D
MKRYITFFRRLNLKTLYFNFKYLPFSQAIRLPFLISRRVYLKVTNGKTSFECPVRTAMVQIGYEGVGIFDHKKSRSIWEVSGEVVFKGKAVIGHGSKISVRKGGILSLGDNFVISAETSIVVTTNVAFGNNNLLSWDILVMDTDFHLIEDESGKVLNSPMPIVIGDKVWIGCRSVILKGANIPDNCVIGANSVLSRELEEEKGVYVGNPIKLVKRNITWNY